MSDQQYTSYEVPIWQAGWAKSMLNDAGIPIVSTSRQGNMIVIIIPAQSAGFDHRAAYKPRRKPWWVPSRRALVTMAMVAVVGVGIYLVLSGGIHINGVELPTLPPVSNPLAGVNANLDATAASVNHAADAARNAAVTFVWLVGGAMALGALWAFRGPLAVVVRGLGGAVQALGKAVKRG